MLAELMVDDDGVIHEEHTYTPPQNDSELRLLADIYEQTQRVRLGLENRLRAYGQGRDETFPAVAVAVESIHLAEKRIAKEMNTAVKKHPAWPWLSQVRGVGAVTACRLLGLLDVERAQSISSFWKFCGLAVVNGEKDRPTKGEKLTYSKRAKQACFALGDSFIKSRSPFRAIYDERKAGYAEAHPDWTPGHCHYAAMRVMEKAFLSCLWQVWREAEGLPVSLPYAHAHLGHVHLYKPEDFI